MDAYDPIMEHALLSLRNNLPRMWRAIYQGCLEAGFDTSQSMCLLQTYILGQNPNGIRPNDSFGPSSDNPE